MSPKPELILNPVTRAPKDRPFIKNNSVINTLEAQFGIRPIKPANKGESHSFDFRKVKITSSPIV